MKILLTVPHSVCPEFDSNDLNSDSNDLDTESENSEHPCDFKAEEMALILKDNLESRGHHVNLELSDTFRAICDLNRRSCRETGFRKRIRKNSSRDTLILDVHSYPGSDETYGQFEFVILDPSGPSSAQLQILRSGMSYLLWIYLLSKGINVGLLQGKDNDIQDEARELGFICLLLEFNEDLPLQRNQYIIKMISSFLYPLSSSSIP